MMCRGRLFALRCCLLVIMLVGLCAPLSADQAQYIYDDLGRLVHTERWGHERWGLVFNQTVAIGISLLFARRVSFSTSEHEWSKRHSRCVRCGSR